MRAAGRTAGSLKAADFAADGPMTRLKDGRREAVPRASCAHVAGTTEQRLRHAAETAAA